MDCLKSMEWRIFREMTSYSLFILPSFALLTVLFYIILKLITNNPNRKRTAILNSYLKNTKSKIKNGDSLDYEEYSQKVNEIINTSDLLDNDSILEKIANYKQSPNFLILRAKLICIIQLYFILMIFYLPPIILISYFFNIDLMRNTLFLSIFSISLLISTVLIITKFSTLNKQFVPKAIAAKKGNILSKLKKVKGFVKLLEPKTSSATYYEPELNSKFYMVKSFIKFLVFGLLLAILYLFLNSILKLQDLETQSTLEVIRSSFLLIALFGFIFSIVRFKNSKYENFSLFFLVMSIYELTRIELTWKFIPILLEITFSITLSILSWMSYLKNRKTRERSVSSDSKFLNLTTVDFLKRNIYNLIPLLFLLIDLEIFIRFLFNLGESFDLLWCVGYVILFILSLKSLIYYLKFYRFLINGIFRPRIRTIIYRMIFLTLYYCLVPYISSVIGPRAYFLILSSNFFQLVVFMSFRFFKNQQVEPDITSENISRISVRKIKSASEERDFQQFIKSKLKDNERYTQIDKGEYILAPLYSRKSILMKKIEQVKEKKIVEMKKELEERLTSLGYVIIPKKNWAGNFQFLDIDYLALKVNEVSDTMRLLVLTPITITNLKGKYIISEQNTYYEPLEQKVTKDNKKLVINLETEHSNFNQSTIIHLLRTDGDFCGYINKKFNLNLTVHKSKINFSTFNTYFQSGPIHIKVIINGILISHTKTGFFNQNLPFPYHKQSNTYFTQLKNLTALVKYLENKYVVIESVVEDNNYVEFEQHSKEKYRRSIKLLRYLLLILGLFGGSIVFLQFLFPDIFTPYFDIFRYISVFIYPILSSIYLLFYINYLKKMIGLVIESLTPYFKRSINTDDQTYNYILELQPKELSTQFNYEHF